MFNSKTCPKCAERIKSRAIKCKFCKTLLVPLPSESPELHSTATQSSSNPTPASGDVAPSAVPLSSSVSSPEPFWHIVICLSASGLVGYSGASFEFAKFACLSLLSFGFSCLVLLAITLTKNARRYRKFLCFSLFVSVFSQACILVNIGKYDEFRNTVSTDWASKKVPGTYPQTFEIFRRRFNRAIDGGDGRLLGPPNHIKNGYQIRNADDFCVQMMFFPSGNPRNIMCGGPVLSDTRVVDQMAYLVAAIKASDSTLSTLEASKVLHKVYRMLDYYLNPKVATSEVGEFDLSILGEKLEKGYAGVGSVPKPFDSWFELDVFLRIVEKGYRVIPQYSLNGYKIDLVVEGMQGRLSVECDGDRWHGAEQYENDAGRQRDLERCGMQFWRVRGSAFYLDPDSALANLWTTLAGLQIHPSSLATQKKELERIYEAPQESAS